MNSFQPDETMLNNYIQNKLSDDDTEKLELWLVDHPEVIQDLELGVMFKQADFDPSTVNQKKPSWFEKLFSNPLLIFSHVAVFAFGLLLLNLTSTENKENTVATFIELEKLRGNSSSIINTKIDENQSLVLRFYPDSLNQKYSLIMQSKITKYKVEFNDLTADDYGSITVSINSADNISGQFDVLISDQGNLEKQRYIINIKK